MKAFLFLHSQTKPSTQNNTRTFPRSVFEAVYFKKSLKIRNHRILLENASKWSWMTIECLLKTRWMLRNGIVPKRQAKYGGYKTMDDPSTSAHSQWIIHPPRLIMDESWFIHLITTLSYPICGTPRMHLVCKDVRGGHRESSQRTLHRVSERIRDDAIAC